MADEEHGPALARRVVHLSQTLFLELGIPDGQHLVDDQDLRLEVRRDRKRETHVHAAGITLHGCLEKSLDAGKSDDLVVFPADLGAAPFTRSADITLSSASTAALIGLS